MGRLTHSRKWALRQAVYGHVLERLDALFEHHSVPYMPIKGAWLIASGLAARLPTRPMDDIDLLVSSADFERAVTLVADQEETTIVPSAWPFEREFTWRQAGFVAHLEIHQGLNYPERFRLPADELFARARERRGERFLPAPEDALAILVCHKLVHVSKSFHRGGTDEIALIAGLPGFEWHRFWETMDSTGVKRFAVLVLRYAAMEIRMPIPFPPQSMPYVDALVRWVPLARYNRLPELLRRIVLEAAFVRDPVGLLRQRVRSGRWPAPPTV